MKKILMMLAFGLFFIQLSSAVCTITPSLINQDPISAVPGEVVKLLFQITGTENPECGNINLEFIEDYPFTLDSGYSKIQTVQGGTYQRDFNSFWMVPYKVRVSPDALDGEQKLSLKTWINTDTQFAKIYDFNVTVEEVRTEFIITLDSYSFTTNKLVLGIVNIGENTAQSITVEVPEQENVEVSGGHVKILGELDSNEDTTVTFDAALKSGPIKINLEYNDDVGERRVISKEVVFSEGAFENTKQKSGPSVGTILFSLIVIALAVYFFLRRRKAKRKSQRPSN
jgi:hypothetical protein